MNSKEKVMKYVFMAFSAVSILGVIAIFYFIVRGGLPFILRKGLTNFIFGTEWAPVAQPASFGIWPMIVGSFAVTIMAMIIGVPIGLFTAIYIARFAPKKHLKFLMPAIELMAGIPSIVYGFFALQAIVPIVRSIKGDGLSALTASILLAIMILPTIVSLSVASINAVPKQYYAGSIALGADDERSVFSVVVPAAKSGIISSIVLAMGRAIGETMAVLKVAGNQARVLKSVFDGTRTMTTNIVMEMNYAAKGDHEDSLIATALVLFCFTLIINAAFMIIKRRGQQ